VFHFHQLNGILGALDDLLASQLHQAQLDEHTFAVHHSNFCIGIRLPFVQVIDLRRTIHLLDT
jgi:hypothetical protein